MNPRHRALLTGFGSPVFASLRRGKLVALSLLLITGNNLLVFSSSAQAPSLINYQGRLLDGTNLVNGNVALSLRLFNVSSGGSSLYEDSNSVTVADGLYNTFIGDHPTNILFLSALTNTTLWIEVAVNGVALSPRDRLASVGYSLTTRGMLLTTNNSVVMIPSSGQNTVAPGTYLAFIAGGFQNVIRDGAHQSSIGGGIRNEIQTNTENGVIAGGNENIIDMNADEAFIGGGFDNAIGPSAIRGVIGGGFRNSIETSASYCVIGGGYNNTASPFGAALAGGENNNIGAGANYAVIGGGFSNSVHFGAAFATIGGGAENIILTNANHATIPGGRNNRIGPQADHALAAGRRAVANHRGTFVWADDTDADFASWTNNQFIIRASGGVGIGTNATTPGGLTVAGAVQATTLAGSGSGISNIVGSSVDAATFSNTFWKTDGNAGTVDGTHFVGTSDNHPLELRARGDRALRIEPRASGAPNMIGGAKVNVAGAGAEGATIAGGGATNYAGLTLINRVDADFGAIGGGAGNSVDDLATAGTIGGGGFNTVGPNAPYSTVAGGFSNSIGDDASFSFIAGGDANTIGLNASHAFAAGRKAAAYHDGSFVWADDQAAQFASTGTNQFLLRATGGVGINTNAPEGDLHVARGSAGAVTAIASSIGIFESGGNSSVSILAPTNFTAGIVFGSTIDANDSGIYYNSGNDRDLRFRTGNNTVRMTITRDGDVGIGTTDPTNELQVIGTVQATAYITGSDRNAKENIQPVPVDEILAKVARLPLATWSFKDDATGTHLGPMAQDFRAAFGLGNTDSGIFTVDADGVALAAIQALKAENDSLKAQLEVLKLRLDALEAR